MSNEDDPPDPAEQAAAPPPKQSLSSFLFKVADAFPFETENLGTIQGRSLSGQMEKALIARLPAKEPLSDLEVGRIFVGCSSGIAEAPNKPVWNPLTPEQAALLTDADVVGYASQYLAKVAKSTPSTDPVASLAAYARAERKRIAEDLEKHGNAVRDSMRDIAATSSVMQNWKELQLSIDGSAADMQRAMKLAMGPASRATDSLREAMDSLHGPRQRAIDEFLAQRASLRGPIHEAMDAAKAQDELVRSSFGPSALQDVMRDFENQVNRPALATEQLRESLEGLDSDYSPSISRLPEIHMPKMPRFEETAGGRTALAVEALRDVGEGMDEKMDLIVGQADNVATLITGVTGEIQEQAKRIQQHSEAQTDKTMRNARWSLCVAAAALVVSAAFGIAGYLGDRDDAKAQAAHAAAMLNALQDQNAKLEVLVQEQAAPAKAAPPPVPAPPRVLPKPAPPATSSKPAPPSVPTTTNPP